MLGGRRFWWFIIGLFLVQAAWIALSGRYPMAFDEDFHLGIIRLYAHHLSPFWSNQPENADMFGAVARDPSYLYQYLMSFPYRLISLFTSNPTATVLILRGISIGFFTTGLVLFRKLLLKAGVSRAIAHLSLLIFVLLPVTPLLAAQINYDNLLLPLVALTLLLVVRLNQMLEQKRLYLPDLAKLLTLCLLTSLVKYAFLPIFLAVVVFLTVRLWQKRHIIKWRSGTVTSWTSMSRYSQAGLLAALIVAAGLFYQRVGINFIRYHSPVPDCSKVLSVEQCGEYGPWIRDYNFELNKVPGAHTPITFTQEWFYGMWLRTFFAVSGLATDFESHGPLLLPSIAAIVFAAGGVLALVLTVKQLLRRYQAPTLWLFATVSLTYLAFIWVDEYSAYLHTGQPVAINGRYLVPVLPLIILLLTLAAHWLTRHWRKLQLSLVIICIVCLAWGGGALTFILRSNDAWDWPNSTVRAANDGVRKTLGPITPGFSQPSIFLH